MSLITWKTNCSEEGLSVIEALLSRVPTAPAGYLRQLCKKRRVIINNQAVSPEQTVYSGELITIRQSSRWLELLSEVPVHPNQVLFEDAILLGVNKPPGLPTHTAVGHEDNLLQQVRGLMKLRGSHFKIDPVNRLDIGTSGIILFGKGKSATRQFGKIMMEGKLTKRYLALVHGAPEQHGILDHPVKAKGKVKESLAEFQIVARLPERALLEINLVTGRQHQIRQQLAMIGHPLVGDKRYGDCNHSPSDRPLLHCHSVSFLHPTTMTTVTIRCDLPTDYYRVLQQLNPDIEILIG